MITHAYTEDQLVEQPAIGLLEEKRGRLRAAWERRNPKVPPIVMSVRKRIVMAA